MALEMPVKLQPVVGAGVVEVGVVVVEEVEVENIKGANKIINSGSRRPSGGRSRRTTS